MESMKRAADILSVLAFVLVLLQALTLFLFAGLEISVAAYGPDEAARSAGLTLVIVLSAFGLLSLIAFILIIIGRAGILNGSKSAPKVLIVAGAMSLSPFALIAGIFYSCLQNGKSSVKS